MPERLVASIGFGVDTYHGVSHGLVLDRIEDTHLIRRTGSRIEAFRDELPRQRPARRIPH
ncbi:hypothetical protein [Streptomyces lavendofoliae]|uniref:hypothetical protein n=1 Tax=Streptomyces lavendofoliae TaxID=67314 RepID=UPI003AEFBFB0